MMTIELSLEILSMRLLNPIYDMSNEGIVYSGTFESCKEEHSNFSYDQSDFIWV